MNMDTKPSSGPSTRQTAPARDLEDMGSPSVRSLKARGRDRPAVSGGLRIRWRGRGGSVQLALEDLPGRGHGQGVHDLDDAGVLVAGHLLLPPRHELLGAGRGTLGED